MFRLFCFFWNTSMVLSVILTYLSWIFVAAIDGNALLSHENGGKFLDPLNFEGARHLIQSCHSEIETNYFEVMIQIEPGQVSSDCSLADLNMLGHDLNAILLDYGIGERGINDEAIFVAGVCPQPTANSEASLFRRSLASGFVWGGAGGCRLCLPDNRDGRRLGQVLNQVNASQDWFNSQFAPDLSRKLKSTIEADIAPNHNVCLGTSPLVNVSIVEILLKEMQISCKDGNILEYLASIKISDTAIPNLACSECKHISFSKRCDGTVLESGKYVSTEWLSQGFIVTASRDLISECHARIFDSSNITCYATEGRNPFFLGSPNIKCPEGGIGIGSGGEPGQPGENCDPVGNVLVIPSLEDNCFTANNKGGKLSFQFQNPVLFSDIGLMNTDQSDQLLEITYADEVIESFAFKSFGINGVQRVIVSRYNVIKVSVVFSGPSAVTEINFCQACTSQPASTRRNKGCITSSGNQTAKTTEMLFYEDFENASQAVALYGWTNGIVNRDCQGNFTAFLGTYTRASLQPYKTYAVPILAEAIIFSFNFYLIDQWTFDDLLSIFIDGERINIRGLDQREGNVKFRGKTGLGIIWKLNNFGPPSNLGFDSFPDQKYVISIEVPRTTKLFSDGKLRLSLQTKTQTASNARSGWDNIKVLARYGCSASQR